MAIDGNKESVVQIELLAEIVVKYFEGTSVAFDRRTLGFSVAEEDCSFEYAYIQSFELHLKLSFHADHRNNVTIQIHAV